MQAVIKENTQNIYAVKRDLRIKAKQRMKAMIMQKLFGLTLLAVGISTPIINGDATISVPTLPLGLYLLFTKEVIL